MSGKVKTSKIWSYYKIRPNVNSEAICNVCGSSVKRGGETSRTFSTSNLINHLKRHPAEYSQFKSTNLPVIPKHVISSEVSEAKKLCSQMNIEESFELQQNNMKWPAGHPKAKAIHCKIAEMISLDFQPFSIVEDEGFQRLLNFLVPQFQIPSRRLITEEVCTELYQRVERALRSIFISTISKGQAVSLTTDLWSANKTPISLLSVTAHWISNFERNVALLNAIPLGAEAHTAVFLSEMLLSSLEKWGLKPSSVFLLQRDNGGNIAKASVNAGIDSRGCFIHTLQLVVKDGLLSQRAVSDITTKCRSIVGHFKHSGTASFKLKEYQVEYGCPDHRLIQDEPTRWDSTLYMLQRILEQKKALIAYQCDQDSLNMLTGHQWILLEKLLNLLSPFEQVTKECSAVNSSIADVIPCIFLLKKALQEYKDDSGVQTMKQELLKSLNSRFTNVESDQKLVLATLMDPRYKISCFQQECTGSAAKKWLEEEMNKMCPPSLPEDTDAQVISAKPVPKKNIFDLLPVLSDTLASRNDFHNLINKYVEEPVLPREVDNEKSCPLEYWKQYSKNFPRSVLPQIACKYLSAPASSVESERLFSKASHLYTNTRSCLKAEKLLFIKCNMKYLNHIVTT